VLFANDRKPFVVSRELVLLCALWVWFFLTSMGAIYPEAAWEKFNEVSKILLMALLVVPFFQDRYRLRMLLLVIAGSLGFYGFKGGLFVLMTGGQHMVLGPPDSFFAANTEVALVMNMALPLLFYLAREETRRWPRRLLWVSFFLTIMTVPFTYSRGGAIGLVVVLLVLFLRARRRLLLVPVVAIGLVGFAYFAPDQWVDRMQTLEDVSADGSAQLRIMSWRVALRIAEDRPVFGGGFKVFVHRATYDIYMPEYPRAFGHDAHSIYFNLIGEHGWGGLTIFVTILVFAFLKLHSIRRLARANPEVGWAANYAHMIQASLATYLVTGAFLSVAYFDLAYQLIILVPLIHTIAQREIAAKATDLAETVPATTALGSARAI
jgi:probable O-glycosylation ligase (exosortase A-associated)